MKIAILLAWIKISLPDKRFLDKTLSDPILTNEILARHPLTCISLTISSNDQKGRMTLPYDSHHKSIARLKGLRVQS
jgi:hypothetical protein